MDEFPRYYKKMLMFLIYALSLSLILWGVFPKWRPIFAGLVLGEAAGLLNVFFLARKVEKMARMAASGEKKRRTPSGFITRVSMAFLVVLIATHYDQYFDLVSTLIGLLLFQFVAMSKGFLYIIRKRKS